MGHYKINPQIVQHVCGQNILHQAKTFKMLGKTFLLCFNIFKCSLITWSFLCVAKGW